MTTHRCGYKCVPNIDEERAQTDTEYETLHVAVHREILGLFVDELPKGPMVYPTPCIFSHEYAEDSHSSYILT